MKDVHTEHCCIIHGCKYMDDDCTVVTKKAPQSYVCEDCESDEINEVKDIKMTEFKFPFSTSELKDCKIDHENVMNNVENIVYGFGVDVTVSYNQSEKAMIFDMNTRTKSELKMVLKINEGVLEWHGRYNKTFGRYNKTFDINNLMDLLETVKYCMYGRDFIDPQWLNALVHYDMIAVRERTVTEIIH